MDNSSFAVAERTVAIVACSEKIDEQAMLWVRFLARFQVPVCKVEPVIGAGKGGRPAPYVAVDAANPRCNVVGVNVNLHVQ